MKYTDIAIQLISEINQKYEIARNDLNSVVGELENSLKKIIPHIKFNLQTISDEFDGTTSRLILDPNSADMEIGVVKITDFFIPSTGYDIGFGDHLKNINEFQFEGKLKTKDDIESFFQTIMSDPNSRVIQAIGFAARRHNLKNESL